MKTNQIILFYDEECPFCKNYTNFLKLKKSFDLKLIDARKNKIELEYICKNLDINDGFIVVYENHCFQGAKALEFLNSAVDKTTIFGKLHFFFAYENVFSKFLYKILFILRKFILFILRKDSKI
jgi:predicted DCC family thiol-disulfide oxidoreductase YuxK